MKWAIPEFDSNADPGLHPVHRSSRIKVNNPLGEGLTLSGSLDLGDVVIGDPLERWVTFTNSGSRKLEITGLTFPENFSYYGTVPEILRVGDSFTIAVIYSPTTPSSITGEIRIATTYRPFKFPITAEVIWGDLTYNGEYYYGGQQIHNGLVEWVDFLYNNKVYYDGLSSFSGEAILGDIVYWGYSKYDGLIRFNSRHIFNGRLNNAQFP